MISTNAQQTTTRATATKSVQTLLVLTNAAAGMDTNSGREKGVLTSTNAHQELTAASTTALILTEGKAYFFVYFMVPSTDFTATISQTSLISNLLV